MELHFIPECYFDTLLVKAILNAKTVSHQQGVHNVVRLLQNKGKILHDDFAVAIVDNDKVRNTYIDSCDLLVKQNNLILKKHPVKMHYFIQLSPAVEHWVITVADEAGIDLREHQLPNTVAELRHFTKSVAAESDPKLSSFCKTIAKCDCPTMITLRHWLTYLRAHHRNADVEQLRSVSR